MKKKAYFLFTILIILLSLFLVLGDVSVLDESNIINPSSIEEDVEGDLKDYLGIESSGRNIHISKEAYSRESKIIFKKEGIVIIRGRTYKGISDSNVNKKPPQIIIDSKGKVIEAYFKTNVKRKFILGADEIDVPAESEIIFKDEKAIIKVPSKGSISPPNPIQEIIEESKQEAKEAGKQVSDDEGRIEIEYQKDSVFSKGDVIFKGAIGYNKGNFYFKGDAEYKKGNKNLIISNPKGVPTEIDFLGVINKNSPHAYISIGDDKVIFGTNSDRDGPGIKFTHLTNRNAFGMNVESKDHIVVKAFANPGGSYGILTNKEGIGLVPKIESVGRIAVDNDFKSVFIEDNKIKLKKRGSYIEEFSSFYGSGSVPLEIQFKKYLDEKIVPFGKGKYVVFSNINELGYGGDPRFIQGKKYKESQTLRTGVSNRILYNYPSEEAFEKITGISLDFDSYSKSKMTKEKYKFFMDIAMGLPEYSRQILANGDGISIRTSAGWGAAAWGWRGGIKVGLNHLTPNTIRHEKIHAATLDRNDGFWSEWRTVGGGSRAYMSDYGSSNEKEDAAEYAILIYKENSEKYLRDSSQAAYYRAQFAVLTKYGAISQKEFDYHLGKIGMPTGRSSLQKYIDVVKR